MGLSGVLPLIEREKLFLREFMTQLMPEEYRKIEIMMDYENERIVTLGDLTPEWWI